MTSKRFYVYGYLREDQSFYYIGKGTGTRAYKPHFGITVPTERKRVVIIVGNLSEVDALQTEVLLIALHGRKDVGTGILRNRTAGGEGTSGYRHSEETKRMMGELVRKRPRECWEKSAAYRRGRKHEPESIAKMSFAARNRTPETEARRKAALKGRKFSEAAKRNMSESHLGKKTRPMSEATKAKIGLSNSGKSPSEATRKKMSLAKAGRTLSAEHRAKIAKAGKKRFQQQAIQEEKQ